MKAFVYDHDWEGAEIYFSESRETAVKYFQENQLQLAKGRVAQHNVKKSGPIPATFLRDVELYSNTEYVDYRIEEYPVEEGATFWTVGGG